MKTTSLLLLSLFSVSIYAQESGQTVTKKAPLTETELQRWSHLDLQKDSIPGMSVDKAYTELLKNKKATKVIVAVVDSGVDINHDDLKAVIWTNPKEIPGNGKDDDKNGFVDDIHGWNFLGTSNEENLEVTRILKKPNDGSELYKKAAAVYLEEFKENNLAMKKADSLLKADATMRICLQKEKYTIDDLKDLSAAEVAGDKKLLLAYAKEKGATFQQDMKTAKATAQGKFDHYLNKSFNPRAAVGDNPDDIKDNKYGNNVVYSKERGDSYHGTHVAGIIAQVRNNNLGGDGVADNVQIMPVRAVPDGDEYDKDIALAIRYAVDNGAKIINGSFGKRISPNATWVYDAIKYAEKKDVLIVHSAGNDSNDIDAEKYYPSDEVDNVEFSNNLITVGALNYEFNDKLVAKFSNYGKKNVDVFAPGVKIYATVTDNKYRYLKGTSMASPNVAGVAALIREYYPNLKASQVKQILMASGIPVNFEVKVGEKQTKTAFSNVCVSGTIVNAYNALKMAEEMSKSPKNNPKL